MKSQKLLIGAATACLLVGTSGAAMAVGCPTGRIMFKTVPEIVIDGEACFIYAVTVEGNVTVTNSPVLNMSFTDVGGSVKVQEGENVTVLVVDILKGDLVVSGYEGAAVVGNELDEGNLNVENNVGAAVSRNKVNGNITCTGNGELEATGNRATGTVNSGGL